MRRVLKVVLGCSFLSNALAGHGQTAAELPHLQRSGAVTQLVVDGEPLILLAGELHNSSPSDSVYMRPIWDRLQAMHLNALIGAASWELVEPEEGHFDFAAVDDQVKQAKAHHMHLVLIWFGSYKNASYTYTPMWVKRNSARFPLARIRTKADEVPHITDTLSVFGTESVKADAHAFATLMAHLRDADTDHTVVMIQVENETGVHFDSRDRSAPADAAYHSAIPAELSDWLRSHSSTMLPELSEVWTKAGGRTSGTWPEVFGKGPEGDEVFMAWYTARYVQTVAEAGARELALPMYVNAWVVQFVGQTPGAYPSGGPVSRMMDVWKLAAPTVALLAPDIYLADFGGVCASYAREDNPVFIPETKPSVSKLFLSIAKFGAIGYSPFGIDDIDDDLLTSAYASLEGMMRPLTTAQAKGTIQLIPAAAGGGGDLSVGDYVLHVERGVHGNPPTPRTIEKEGRQDVPPAPGESVKASSAPTSPVNANSATVVEGGYLHALKDERVAAGMIVPDGTDSFYIVGNGLAITVSSRSPKLNAYLGIVEEGPSEQGARRLNGDETFGGFRIVIGPDAVTATHVQLYSVPR